MVLVPWRQRFRNSASSLRNCEHLYQALPGMGSTMPWVAEQAGIISVNQLQLIVKEPGESIPGKEIFKLFQPVKLTVVTVPLVLDRKNSCCSLIYCRAVWSEAPEYLAWLYYGNG